MINLCKRVNLVSCPMNNKLVKSFKENYKKPVNVAAIGLMLVGIFFQYFVFSPTASATAPTVSYIRFDRLAAGSAISGTACLNTTDGGSSEDTVKITFPSSWTVSGTASDWTTTTTNLPTGASAWPGISSPATNVTSKTVTFSSTSLSSATLYCFNFAGASSTVGSAGNDQTGVWKTLSGSGSINNDLINYATSVVVAGADQVTVTGTVPSTFSFALSGTGVALGTLSTSAASSGNVTMTTSTNARNGWVSWVKAVNSNSTSGLYSSSSGGTISSPSSFPTTTDLASATGVVLDADAGTGTPSIDAGYDGGNVTSGGHLDTTFNRMAYHTAPASGDTVTVNVRAKIAATQAAASDYTDTLTITAAGNF